MRIIIIDDDIPTTEVIRDTVNWKMLQIDKIDIAHNITSAKKYINNNTPDIVLCDIEMPQGSGLELLQWLRENQFKSQFIFLTCHENFSYATKAMHYNALDYITKPFQLNLVQSTLAKAVEKIVRDSAIENDLLFKDYWLDNQNMLEEGFWRDLMFFALNAEAELIKTECNKRHLSIDLDAKFRLALCTVPKRHGEQNGWIESAFRYALRNLSSELILFNFENLRNLIYTRNDFFYILIVLQDVSEDGAKERCANFVSAANIYLSCVVRCYISEECTATQLPAARTALERADIENVVEKAGVYLLRDVGELTAPTDISIAEASQMLNDGKVLEAINHISAKLQAIASRNQLSHTVLNNILQDYNQMIYVKLQSHNIPVHEIFGDNAAVKLRQAAEYSLFNAMKWISYSASKTVEHLEETLRLEGVVAKIKRYISEHINEPVSRNEIAAIVFLTPDYVSKIFKAETGISLKDYMNEARIEKAKELLRTSIMSISEIAVEVGFDNFSYFSTLFKKITGTSPSAYNRKK